MVKGNRLFVRLSDYDMNRVNALTEKLGMTAAEWLQYIIRKELDNKNSTQGKES